MVKAKSEVAQKSKNRLLKLLSKHGVDGLPVRIDAKETIISNGNRKYKFPTDIIEQCIGQRLISTANKNIIATKEGRAYLVQFLHPQMDYNSQHMAFSNKTIFNNGTAHKVLVNDYESPLSRLYQRRDKTGAAWLDEYEYKAGERLRSDFEKSQLQPNISANWESRSSTGSHCANGSIDISDFAIDARKRLEKSLNELGPELAGVALDACCFLKGLEVIEKERVWPPRSAKLMLRTALRKLVCHYGLKPNRRDIRNLHWGDEGYKPAHMRHHP